MRNCQEARRYHSVCNFVVFVVVAVVIDVVVVFDYNILSLLQSSL